MTPFSTRRRGPKKPGDTVSPARARGTWVGGASGSVKRGDVRTKLLWVLAPLALTLLLVACSGGNKPQSTWDAAGPTARTERNLIVPVFWVAAVVFLIVEGGIVVIAIKYRHRKGRDQIPAQIHGNTKLELGWTILPALVLAGVMVPTIAVIWDLAKPPGPDALNVTVHGYQWWWGFEYTDPDMTTNMGSGHPLWTADVLVIPVDRPVYLTEESDGGVGEEVIHSFWVPRLAGKQDVVPGRTNHITLAADEPGTYWGQCAEYCGLQHGRMRFRVIALEQPDWEDWVNHEQLPADLPAGGLAKKGLDIFFGTNGEGGQCIACHAVGGTEAQSTNAPNLTHFAAPTHQCFAGCDFETFTTPGGTEINEADLAAWLRDPNAVKLGAKMPNYHLTDQEINALVAYLGSLK
jgi:cytochrome c oxidase subunit 2